MARLLENCPTCGKVAIEKFRLKTVNKLGEDITLITLECFHIISKVIPKATPYESLVSNDWKPEVKQCNHTWLKNYCTTCGEYKLFNFQVQSCKDGEVGLATQKGFGVFHDMGLGKTVIALGLIKFHVEYTPTLYVVKSKLKFKWYKEIIRWLSPNYMPQVIATSRDFIYPNLKGYIISASLLPRIKLDKLQALNIKCIVLDECQQFSNPDSSRTGRIRQLVHADPSIKVIPLSGTPWKNRGSEFFTVLNMIDPVRFHSLQAFLDEHVEYYFEGSKRKMGGFKNPLKFRDYCQGLLTRYEFEEVMDEYPETNRMKLNVQLDNLAQSTYDESVSEFVKWYNDAVISGEEDALNGIEILAKMSRMRHITGLAKIPATLGYVEEFLDSSEKKLTIFVHHKDVGEILISHLTDRSEATNPDYHDLATDLMKSGFKVMKLNAAMSDEESFVIQEAFNTEPRVVLVASTLANGEGIDLQTCHTAVMHERQWNPANEDQAAPGRFKRIGQTSPVINITFAEAEGTIDEHFDHIVSSKRRAFHATMNTSKEIQWDTNDIGKQMAEMIVAKHREKMRAKGKEIVTPAKSLTAQASF